MRYFLLVMAVLSYVGFTSVNFRDPDVKCLFRFWIPVGACLAGSGR